MLENIYFKKSGFLNLVSLVLEGSTIDSRPSPMELKQIGVEGLKEERSC